MATARRGGTPAEEPAGEVMELESDGTIRVGWEGQPPFRLRVPKLKQLRTYLQDGDRADKWVRPASDETQPAPDEKRLSPPPKTALDMLPDDPTDNPYTALYVRVFEELGGLTIAPGALDDGPPWLTSAGTFNEWVQHWRSSPLARLQAAALRQAASSLS